MCQIHFIVLLPHSLFIRPLFHNNALYFFGNIVVAQLFYNFLCPVDHHIRYAGQLCYLYSVTFIRASFDDLAQENDIVGKIAGERAKEKGIEAVVFDRGGYLYTGRVQALADGAREAGLKF